ncbi:hypothetical protein [Actinomadura madurae]|uniref:hypothetical protein n=1 Tax=Actinomadura madurae TaxID=1993 RepID=UPI002026788B|nr:hypothetical protein [Actinomadura madurae]MCP9951833.1 hypothetical protein [Actinomadura madurae]MCP9981078.1 hypothetical protein [Actinomadura madurae]MCQ0017272.1 hypothetical protein [Actinomadura madurae]URM97123.1 hypothetical protein LUW76_23760 [Actinomadura madurae]URN07887.1 hypothetical protein LUW74_34015 [Actinomadura madurae]
MSLRWKISAVIALVSTAAAVALSLTVHVAFARRQADEARRLQTERLDLVLREYARTGAPAFGGTLDDPDLPRNSAEPPPAATTPRSWTATRSGRRPRPAAACSPSRPPMRAAAHNSRPSTGSCSSAPSPSSPAGRAPAS